MQVLIVEDEMLLARRLQKMLGEIDPGARVLAILQSVEEAVQWFRDNQSPDLILMDIELADGQSFDIFTQTEVSAPIIFTTAYDEYAVRAFKVNSVDYLLKPVKEEELKAALRKFRSRSSSYEQPDMQSLLLQIKALQPPADYRTRFLVKQGQKLISIDVLDVAYFFSENKLTFLRTLQNHKYIVDYVLDNLEKELSPKQFFRANRQYILSSKSVMSIHPWFNQKLHVEVKPATEEQVIISRDKANAFKTWMGE